jgi:hypothetical protein
VFHERDGYDRTGGGLRSLPSFIISKLTKKEKKRPPSLKTKEKEKKTGKKSGSGQDRVDVLPPTHLACFLCVIGWAESLFQMISWIGSHLAHGSSLSVALFITSWAI